MKDLLPTLPSTNLSSTNSEKKDNIEEIEYYIEEIKNIALKLLLVIPEDESNIYWTDDYDPFYGVDELNRWFVIEQLEYINKLEIYLKNFYFEDINLDFENFKNKLINLAPMKEAELPSEFFMDLSEIKKFDILVTNNVVNILFWIMSVWKLIYKDLDKAKLKEFEEFLDKLIKNKKINTILDKERYWFNATLVIPDPNNKKLD